MTMANKDTQKQRFIKAAREAGADMGKKEFSRLVGKIAKPKPKRTEKQS